jgi:MSHA biogenesis protein MshK
VYKVLICTGLIASSAVNASQREVDPTRPLIGSLNADFIVKAKSELVLQSIIESSDGQKKKAIINGQLLQAGDSISIYKVIEVTGKTVTLRSPDIERTLSLFSKAVVKNK